MKIIFLDIDGVLNGYNLRVHITFKILRLIFNKHARKYFDLFGIHIMKVFILWIIIKISGAKVVLTSSWRGGYWNIPVNEMTPRTKKLYKLFQIFNIDVIGITGRKHGDRGAQINDWFEDNKNIDIKSFIIIDDEMFDISSYYPNDKLLNTKADEKRLIKFKCCGCYDGAGLRFKHIIPAIKILKNKK